MFVTKENLQKSGIGYGVITKHFGSLNHYQKMMYNKRNS
jgi:hypothetical protein